MMKMSRALGHSAAVAMWSCVAVAASLGLVGCAGGGGDEPDPTLPPPGENIVIPITVDNLEVVLLAEWIDVDTLCQGVEDGTLAACG